MDSSTTNNELFICFASRLSSSSMKISSSKSILSPGRVRDPPNTLPTSLSRRLRSNGSIKGGQASPMFPTAAKKRASTFDNPEPSSPKVTCIGQVRVKTKNKGRKLRTLSRKQSTEMSFRKLEQQQGTYNHNQNQLLDFQNQPPTECLPQQKNQRWVHLPVTICDAFSCLFPCRYSCFSTGQREDKAVVAINSTEGGGERQSSCPEVFARWLVAVQEGEAGDKERDIVNECEMRNSRRHIFDELEISDDICRGKNEDSGKMEEGRISISVPPKNALLLMRCRSDPNKMAALANRFWESPVVEDEDQDEEDKAKDEEEKDIEENDYLSPEQVVSTHVDEEEEQQSQELESVLYVEFQNNNGQGTQEDSDLDMSEELLLLFQETEVHQKMDLEWENASGDHQTEVNEEDEESVCDIEEEKRSSYCSSSSCSLTSDEESQETEEYALCSETESAIEEVTEEEKTTNKRSDPENAVIYKVEEEEEDSESSFLPDCLLMMMCEPKLSMAVSKETWVCSTDFIRRRPKKEVNQIDCRDGESKKVSTDPGEALHHPPIKIPPAAALAQPPRWSCSLPVSNIAMASMIEQKLVNAVGYEPFVLTRCKSAPLRSAPDTCCWKNRNLELHRHANFGVGAAGIGF